MQVNPLTREVLVKLVYYGPGLGGKTTSLKCVHEAAPPETRGQIVSLATPVDRTLYFDFLPLRLPPIREHHIRLQLFTVPGQVYFNATRKLVLTGADGVVFVADSQRKRHDANLESMENLLQNLSELGRGLSEIPWVIQYNKRDLADVLSEAELGRSLNDLGVPAFPTCATRGDGVVEALDVLVRRVLEDLEARGQLGGRPSLPVELGRADQALEEHIGRASELLWDSTLARARTAPKRPPTMPPEGELGASERPAEEPLRGPTKSGERAPSAPPGKLAEPRPSREPVTATAGPSFAALFPESLEDVLALEEDLAFGRLSRAISRADTLVTRTLSDTARHAGLPAPADPSLLALLLGLDGVRWLGFARLVARVRDGGPVAERDALEAYALAIELRLAKDRIL
jgi:signal recognition particle receptor subunit beta